MQTIEYEGDASIAVDLLFAGLLDRELWSPGDWLVSVQVQTSTDDVIAYETVEGFLMAFKQTEDSHVVTIQPFSVAENQQTGPEVDIDTNEIVKVVVP